MMTNFFDVIGKLRQGFNEAVERLEIARGAYDEKLTNGKQFSGSDYGKELNKRAVESFNGQITNIKHDFDIVCDDVQLVAKKAHEHSQQLDLTIPTDEETRLINAVRLLDKSTLARPGAVKQIMSKLRSDLAVKAVESYCRTLDVPVPECESCGIQLSRLARAAHDVIAKYDGVKRYTTDSIATTNLATKCGDTISFIRKLYPRALDEADIQRLYNYRFNDNGDTTQ